MMKNKGFTITYILIFGSVFMVILAGLLGLVLSQFKMAKFELSYEQSLHIAEAGLDRYKWYLVHKSDDIANGLEIGCPPSDCISCGECEYEVSLPGLGVVGRYNLDISEERSCGVTTSIAAIVTAWTLDYPNIDRRLRVNYIKPTVAEYSYIINDNVWAGSDRIILGPYHSNGGIRMDGENNSLVTSEQEEWLCTSSFGCSSCPSGCYYSGGCRCPGVFTTANGHEDLFRTGVGHFDFEGITVDLGIVKNLTLNEGKGLYLPPSNEEGYHVIINDRQVSVRKVEDTNSIRAYNSELGSFYEYSIIDDESSVTNYNLGDCGLIFIEDQVWIEGDVDGNITLAVGDLITPGLNKGVWLLDSLTYNDEDSGLVLISQDNALISPDGPDYMDLNGIIIAQNGRFGINHYTSSNYKKELLTINGTIVSNGSVGTKWSSGSVWVSGFRERRSIYNPNMSYSPPPFLPTISEEFEFKGWEELLQNEL